MFFQLRTFKGEGSVGPLAVSPLIELELRGTNDRVARDERKTMIPNFKILSHQLTFQVRSMTQKSGNRDLLERRKGWLLCFFFRGADHEYTVSYDNR